MRQRCAFQARDAPGQLRLPGVFRIRRRSPILFSDHRRAYDSQWHAPCGRGGETTAACEMIRVFLLKGRIVGRRPRLCESVEAVFSVESIAFGPDEDAETLS